MIHIILVCLGVCLGILGLLSGIGTFMKRKKENTVFDIENPLIENNLFDGLLYLYNVIFKEHKKKGSEK